MQLKDIQRSEHQLISIKSTSVPQIRITDYRTEKEIGFIVTVFQQGYQLLRQQLSPTRWTTGNQAALIQHHTKCHSLSGSGFSHRISTLVQQSALSSLVSSVQQPRQFHAKFSFYKCSSFMSPHTHSQIIFLHSLNYSLALLPKLHGNISFG